MKTKDFVMFLEVWNMQQNYKTPLIHTLMAEWLQTSWDNGDTRLLLMAFRASGKSTLIGAFSAWLLWRNPDLRILVLAAESSLANKMVRNIRKIIERHSLTKTIIPKNPDQWAVDRFTVKRDKELRDPSVLAAGITANITGSRADIILYDDVEVPNTADSVEKRQNLRERLGESNFTLVPDGTQIYIGTPHSYFSIYADTPRTEINEEGIFLDGFKRLEIPLLNKRGQSVWPEQFSKDAITLLKKQSGPHKFASQMLLKPTNIIDGRLDINLLRFYDDDIRAHEAQQQTYLFLGDKKIISCSAWWDPAFGSAAGDSSVLAVIFTDEDGLHYLHHLSYIHVRDDQQDEATAQCQYVCGIAKQYLIPAIAIETNGIGKFLPAILRRELAKQNIPCAVMEQANYRAKELRILESFDAVMAAKALHVHQDIRQTPFLTEMMEWQPTRKNQRDDGLDAVAGAMSLEPVRLKRFYTHAKKRWQGDGKQQHEAKTDFII